MSTPPASGATNGQTASPNSPSFDTVKQGFHPGQVQGYITDLWDYAHQLEQQVAQAARGTLTQLIHHEESSGAGQQLITELMKLATDEITGQKAAASAEAAQLLSDARSQAAQLLDEARAEATQVVTAAHSQADTVLTGARAEAKTTMDTAAVKAAQVSDGAERRLGAVVDTHQETVRRLREIHDVTGKLIEAEDNRGPIEQEGQAKPQVQVAAAAAPELRIADDTLQVAPPAAQDG